MKIVTYILTHNSPRRLDNCLSRLRTADPDFFDHPIIVVDQSTVDDLARDNAIVAEKFGVSIRRNENLGASGGRWYCAQLFHESDADAMFYFEDDQVWNNGTHPPRDGLRIPVQIEKPFSNIIACLEAEYLGYLKLNFQEVYDTHRLDCGAPCNKPLAKYNVTYVNGQMLFVGDAYYSNWPMLITKETSRLIFDGPPVTEGAVMVNTYRIRASGKFRAGVLAASPILHCGIDDHRPDDIDLQRPH